MWKRGGGRAQGSEGGAWCTRRMKAFPRFCRGNYKVEIRLRGQKRGPDLEGPVYSR